MKHLPLEIWILLFMPAAFWLLWELFKQREATARVLAQLAWERKQSEESRYLLERYKAAIDRFAIVAETDIKGKITYVNHQFCKISKYEEAELIGKDHREVVNSKYHSKEFWEEMWKTIQSGQVWRGEIKNRAKDDTIYWVDTTIVPFVGKHGKPEKYLAVRFLTTDRKAAEENLSEFAHIVSHDLKAPLRAIGALSSFLITDNRGKLSKESFEDLTRLQNRVHRLNSLINGILDYSRIGRQEGTIEEVDLNAIVEDVKELIMPPEHFRIEISERLPRCDGDRTRLFQIFQNLVSNAIKYNDKPEGLVRIACESYGQEWKISVSDNGPGIDPKYHAKVFKVFQTLQARDTQESTGIGLSLVKKIVEMYGGKIWIEPSAGSGTSFIFTLPKHLRQKNTPAPITV